MKKEAKKDFIFKIIDGYYLKNKDLDRLAIHEILIEKGFDISNEVLDDRIKYFIDETSKTDTKKSKGS